MPPRVPDRIARAARTSVLVASLVLLAGAAHAQILYPRLALPGCIHGTGIPYLDSLGAYNTVTLDAVSRYDEVILDVSPVTEYHPDILSQLRQRNPGITMLGYATAENIWDVNDPDSLVHFTTRYNHMIRDLNGFLYDRAGQKFTDYDVNLAKRDASGRFVVAEAIANLFYDAVIRTQLWDGMFVDVFGDNILWIQSPAESIDIARAGYANATDFDVAWHAATDTLASRLRALAGPNFILVGNTGIGSKYSTFNGWTREDFPFQEGGTWYTNMFWDPGGYFADEKHFRQPVHNAIFTPIDDHQPFSVNNLRRVRFGLASAAMGTGFATTGPSDRSLQSPPHDQWWYDEYAVDVVSGRAMTDRAYTHWLGKALGAPYQMVWAGTNPDASTNPGFETDVTSGWAFGRFAPAVATLSRDTTNAPAGRACAHVHVDTPGVYAWDVNLTTTGSLLMLNGYRYSATFWARASSPRPLMVVATLPAGGQTASQSVGIDTTWHQYQVVLQPSQNSLATLEFFLGTQAGDTWFDDVHLQQGETSLWRRDFENGIVLINPALTSLQVPLGSNFRHILGTRDPVTNDGSTIASVTVPPSDAIFLIGSPADTVPPNTIIDARIRP